jgi:hypothetical protein
MVSTIFFIQANLQHRTAASRILTRTLSVKGIDMALVQELWWIDRFLRDEILASKPLHPNQHAYQAGKYVEMALHQLGLRRLWTSKRQHWASSLI